MDRRTSTMPLDTLTDLWRPGSRGDDWTWNDEHRELIGREVTRQLLADIAQNGVREPVLLAYDGRVWDGHHRIVCAMGLSLTTGGRPLALPVEFIPIDESDQS